MLFVYFDQVLIYENLSLKFVKDMRIFSIWYKFLRLELGRVVLCILWVFSFWCFICQVFFFLRGNNDFLSVWMCISSVFEMIVVMRFSLGGDRLYSLFSFFLIYFIVM